MHGSDWNDFRYFLAICRQGTLAGAARILKVQHSTVGRRLEALEDGLGTSLFTRTPDGFVLTEAGTDIRALVEEAEKALGAVERRVAGNDDKLEGLVRLTTSETFSTFLVRRLSELHEHHPKLIVEVLTGNRNLDLTRREADFAIRIAKTLEPDLICRSIGQANWSLYASPSYVARLGVPRSPEDLSGHDLIAFDGSMATVPGALWLSEHGAGANVVLRGNSIIAVLNAAIVGMGMAILPCFLGDSEPTLRRLTDQVLGMRDIWLVFHPDVARVARVRYVMDFVVERIQSESRHLRGEARRA